MRFISALMLVLSVVFLGCGKDKPEPVATETSPEARNLPTPADTATFVPAQVPVQTQPEVVNIEPAIQIPTEIEVVKSNGGNFTLQVSSWMTAPFAQQDADRFNAAGYDAYVSETSLGENEPWYRVRIGRYETYAQAQQSADAFNAMLQSGFWVDNYREN